VQEEEELTDAILPHISREDTRVLAHTKQHPPLKPWNLTPGANEGVDQRALDPQPHTCNLKP
jgi:hypothetical protein